MKHSAQAARGVPYLDRPFLGHPRAAPLATHPRAERTTFVMAYAKYIESDPATRSAKETATSPKATRLNLHAKFELL